MQGGQWRGNKKTHSIGNFVDKCHIVSYVLHIGNCCRLHVPFPSPRLQGFAMKQLIALCIAAAFAGTAFAAAPEAAPVAKTAQQSKMTTCNADAAGKKGDERKAFMKECLSAPKK